MLSKCCLLVTLGRNHRCCVDHRAQMLSKFEYDGEDMVLPMYT